MNHILVIFVVFAFGCEDAFEIRDGEAQTSPNSAGDQQYIAEEDISGSEPITITVDNLSIYIPSQTLSETKVGIRKTTAPLIAEDQIELGDTYQVETRKNGIIFVEEIDTEPLKITLKFEDQQLNLLQNGELFIGLAYRDDGFEVFSAVAAGASQNSSGIVSVGLSLTK